MPGSSPDVRTGIEAIQYQYGHGKAHMLEKRLSKQPRNDYVSQPNVHEQGGVNTFEEEVA